MSITITLETTRLKCQSCDFLFTDDSPADVKARFDPAYECGNCGNVFTKDDTENGDHKCPECSRFAAKCDPDEYLACEECGAAAQFEEVYVITCVCHDEEHEVYA